jgi:hypothetical protein
MDTERKLPSGIGKYPPFMWEALMDLGWNKSWTEYDTLDGWLKWEGIIGFTPKIVAAVLATAGVLPRAVPR